MFLSYSLSKALGTQISNKLLDFTLTPRLIINESHLLYGMFKNDFPVQYIIYK